MTASEQGAETVVLSYAPADDRTATALDAESYRAYLRRTRDGPVAVGDEFEEFVNCGCGTTRDVSLRVEDVVGTAVVTSETRFVFEPRDD
jgi:succinate dehydrogenase/fumarate reductase-like Fe-S protein